MITELLKVDPAIIGGRKIMVNDYNIRNYRLHQVMEQLSRMLLFCLECDTNNTASKAIPRDVRKIRQQWQIVQDELKFSMEHNDLPKGAYEYSYTIALLDQKEIQKIRNVKVKRIVSESFNAARAIMTLDSANTQGFIAAEDYQDILVLFKVVEDCMARWIGTGKDATDTGILAPAYEELGELVPDVDSDYAVPLEPSAGMPLPVMPDVPDTEATKK